MATEPIVVAVFDNSHYERPPDCCTTTWSPAETMEVVSTQLKARYGDIVEIEYIDLAKSANAERYPEMALLSQEISDRLPIVTVNGMMRMMGNVEYWGLITSIEVLLEARSK